jgi:HAD superfamily hydrolase (TIGR01549 family)
MHRVGNHREMPGPDPIDTVVLDVDGTLIDSNYHHVWAWCQAFREVHVDVPLWRIHRAIGMGSDRLVTEVAGADVEQRYGDRVREAHDTRYGEVLDAVRPLPGARELLEALHDRGLKVVLASSGKPADTEHALRLLHGDHTTDAATTSSEVEHSKPAPDLMEVAVGKVDGHRAVAVGDSVWDFAAARRAGLPGIGLLTGGYGAAELLEAGAAEVFSSPQDLLDNLDRTPLGISGGPPRRRT